MTAKRHCHVSLAEVAGEEKGRGGSYERGNRRPERDERGDKVRLARPKKKLERVSNPSDQSGSDRIKPIPIG